VKDPGTIDTVACDHIPGVADGYTILMGTVVTHALNPLILKSTPYDPEKDFAPISLLVLSEVSALYLKSVRA
jgi:tripartite-type tricarboxylate transporter receptor subunit TctC